MRLLHRLFHLIFIITWRSKEYYHCDFKDKNIKIREVMWLTQNLERKSQKEIKTQLIN